jgi:hypothetical protein
MLSGNCSLQRNLSRSTHAISKSITKRREANCLSRH